MRVYLISLLLVFFQFAFAETPKVLHWGGTGEEEVTDALTSSAGDTYITGRFTGSLVVEDKIYESRGGYDLFFTKVDGSNRPVWTKILHSENDISSGQLAFGPRGEIVWIASVNGSATLDGQRLTPLNDASWVVVNVHSNGKVLDVQYQEGPMEIGAIDLSYDKEGYGYLLATYRDAEQDGDWVTSLSKWGWSGDPIWTKTFTGVRNTKGGALGLDAMDMPVVLLNFTATLKIGDASFTANGNSDFVVAAIDKDGEIRWTTRSSGEGHDKAQALAFDAEGNLYVAGLYTQNLRFGAIQRMSASGQDIFLVGYTNSGSEKWVRTGRGGIGPDDGLALLTTHEGIFLTGIYTEGITFGKRSLSGTSSRDAYIARYAPNGLLKEVKRAGGMGMDSGIALAQLRDEQLMIGTFQGKASFDGTTLKAVDQKDIFVWIVK